MTFVAIAYHPWEDLLEEIEERGWSQKDFAKLLWVSTVEVNDLIRGRRNITPRLASRIGEAFGTSAEVWLGLQNMYDLYTLSTNKIEVKELKAIQTRKQELALA